MTLAFGVASNRTKPADVVEVRRPAATASAHESLNTFFLGSEGSLVAKSSHQSRSARQWSRQRCIDPVEPGSFQFEGADVIPHGQFTEETQVSLEPFQDLAIREPCLNLRMHFCRWRAK